MIHIGTEVTWITNSSGNLFEKSGRILAHVFKKESLFEKAAALGITLPSNVKDSTDQIRYLIEATTNGKVSYLTPVQGQVDNSNTEIAELHTMEDEDAERTAKKAALAAKVNADKAQREAERAEAARKEMEALRAGTLEEIKEICVSRDIPFTDVIAYLRSLTVSNEFGASKKEFFFKGKGMSLTEIAKDTGMAYTVLYQRIANGWSVEKAISTPVKEYTKATSTYESDCDLNMLVKFGVKPDVLDTFCDFGVSLNMEVSKLVLVDDNERRWVYGFESSAALYQALQQPSHAIKTDVIAFCNRVFKDLEDSTAAIAA